MYIGDKLKFESIVGLGDVIKYEEFALIIEDIQQSQQL